ncbi:SEFIR domain-containing protein [Geosporobacter ferrireducens]|uniref:SEFIR domain-containing protein n=1 Tax=Geosporobacter ferrireducens TaxID=1424294 RepID=A0A1D8GI13_9FIRM|nr:SEFIR domain-containing protein [Geosporobacter ferrireducens]AOT70556.1 hypothetical protein Gferi_13830 [Geosporobacter ferrireducens]
MTDKITTAFLSYSWDSPDHEKWVINLTNRLRIEGGIDANCDKFEIYTQTTDLYSMMFHLLRKMTT